MMTIIVILNVPSVTYGMFVCMHDDMIMVMCDFLTMRRLRELRM